jgi:hypothetical protein
MKRILIGVAAALFAGGVSALDTSKIILCAATDVIECAYGSDCDAVLPEEVNAPTFMRINIKKKEIIASQERPPTKIDHIEDVENRLVLQGVEDGSAQAGDGTGWTVSIDKQTARMVMTATVEQAAIVIFGACTELK